MIRDGKRVNIAFDMEGNPLLVSPSSGEIIAEGHYTEVFPGDIVLTPGEQAARKEYVQELLRQAGRRTASRDLGAYFFISGRQRFEDLKPQTAARLIYLQTFCDFAEDKGNRIRVSRKQDMYRADLPKILGISYDSANSFWKEVSPRYLIEDGNGVLFSNLSTFTRGRIDPGSKHYRAFIRGVRKLYEGTPKSKHRHVGYLFQLLPFINVEFNALCYNPGETVADEIDYMTLDEFCDLIGYDRNRRDRLLKIYRDLTFEVPDKHGTHMERFLSITGDGLDKGNHKIFINPRVLYSGSDYKQAAILGGLSKP